MKPLIVTYLNKPFQVVVKLLLLLFLDVVNIVVVVVAVQYCFVFISILSLLEAKGLKSV